MVLSEKIRLEKSMWHINNGMVILASVVLSGLVISVDTPWLAASSDGIVHDPTAVSPKGLVEFKRNPFSVREKTIAEASESKTFCLENSGSSVYSLKKRHDYYYQVYNAKCTAVMWNGAIL